MLGDKEKTKAHPSHADMCDVGLGQGNGGQGEEFKKQRLCVLNRPNCSVVVPLETEPGFS